jgi:hypothetical protein
VANVYNAGKFELTLKDLLLIIVNTAIALGSTRSNDPWLVVPMLGIAAIISVVFCIRHKGNIWVRFLSATTLVLVLGFVGWRDLRQAVPPPPVINSAAPRPLPASVNQNANNSDCSNIVAGGDVNNCTSSERAHGKNKR